MRPETAQSSSASRSWLRPSSRRRAAMSGPNDLPVTTWPPPRPTSWPTGFRLAYALAGAHLRYRQYGRSGPHSFIRRRFWTLRHGATQAALQLAAVTGVCGADEFVRRTRGMGGKAPSQVDTWDGATPAGGDLYTRTVNWSRYVALGDSFTEGLDDPNPDGTYRGWADRVAEK